jgi:hypothetical protein
MAAMRERKHNNNFNQQYEEEEYMQQQPVQGAAYSGFVPAPVPGEMVTLPRPSAAASTKSFQQQPMMGQQYQHQQQYEQYPQYPQYAQQQPEQPYYYDQPMPAPPSAGSQRGLLSTANAPFMNKDDDAVRRFDKEFVYKEKQSRCMYLCIPTNKRSRTICLASVATILVLLGILIGVFFPKTPEFEILNISPADSNAYTFSGFDAADPSKLAFSMQMVLTIAVNNQNSYDFKVDGIKLAVMIDANGTEINNSSPVTAANFFGSAPQQKPRPYITKANYRNQIASGKQGFSLFPANKKINITMPLQVDFKPDASMGVFDPVLNEIIQVCAHNHENQNTPNAGPLTRNIKIYYKAENSIGILRYIGMTPTIEGTSKINCKF